jgi:hypothetical protein
MDDDFTVLHPSDDDQIDLEQFLDNDHNDATKSTSTTPINVNVKFKRDKDSEEEQTANKREKKNDSKNAMMYKAVEKHTDENRDLYFVKLVAGALKRRNFQSLIEVEGEEENDRLPKARNSRLKLHKVKYTYSNDLLYAWTTVIEKIKLMIEPTVLMTNPNWSTTEKIHNKMIENDTAVTAFSRYVAFVLMSETNNFIPRNRTRFTLEMDERNEGYLILDVMRALFSQFDILKESHATLYNIK